ncbi:DUF4913 domain-containing protein [Streptomyces sp. NP160]|uniref:DUF4913 domain-containing protein n=1 Tax=Streptomyces sp. NP160 TaxID=2586637 RepID=UPI0011183310|nr:DUF4913 domain-containing protein [Streptomyces sp. NP160]TNM67589.1 DUF4913 domain-containing protein [Streptomyces sp. NP160]
MTGANSERWQAEVDARLARLELRADEAELADIGLGPPSNNAHNGEDDYSDLDSWVLNYFCATFPRPLGGEFRWCSRWREHREAVVRFEALWRSWKALRYDPALGMSTWLHQFLDPQLVVLLSSRGPFSSCSSTRHEETHIPPLDRVGNLRPN